MLDAALDVQEDIEREGEDCIFSVVSGVTVVSKTVKAIPTAYSDLFSGDYGDGNVVAKIARLMVSELALKAVGYPVRNTANKVALKGHRITYTDISGSQATYIVKEQYPNGLTGLIRLDLSDYVVSTPPGRTIIGWISQAIYFQIVETPNGDMQTLANGDEIPTQYALNEDGSLTIPGIAGWNALTPFMYSQFPIDNMPYDMSGGTFTMPEGSEGFVIGAYCGVNVSIPLYANT